MTSESLFYKLTNQPTTEEIIKKKASFVDHFQEKLYQKITKYAVEIKEINKRTYYDYFKIWLGINESEAQNIGKKTEVFIELLDWFPEFPGADTPGIHNGIYLIVKTAQSITRVGYALHRENKLEPYKDKVDLNLDLLKALIKEVGLEAARIIEFQIAALQDEQHIEKLAEHAGKRILKGLASLDHKLDLNRNDMLEALFSKNFKMSSLKVLTILKDSHQKITQWKVDDIFTKPGLRHEENNLNKLVYTFYDNVSNVAEIYGYRNRIMSYNNTTKSFTDHKLDLELKTQKNQVSPSPAEFYQPTIRIIDNAIVTQYLQAIKGKQTLTLNEFISNDSQGNLNNQRGIISAVYRDIPLKDVEGDKIQNANFDSTDWIRSNFTGIKKIENVKLTNGLYLFSDFSNIEYSEVSTIAGSDFTMASLRKSSIPTLSMNKANLDNTDMRGAIIQENQSFLEAQIQNVIYDDSTNMSELLKANTMTKLQNTLITQNTKINDLEKKYSPITKTLEKLSIEVDEISEKNNKKIDEEIFVEFKNKVLATFDEIKVAQNQDNEGTQKREEERNEKISKQLVELNYIVDLLKNNQEKVQEKVLDTWRKTKVYAQDTEDKLEFFIEEIQKLHKKVEKAEKSSGPIFNNAASVTYNDLREAKEPITINTYIDARSINPLLPEWNQKMQLLPRYKQSVQESQLEYKFNANAVTPALKSSEIEMAGKQVIVFYGDHNQYNFIEKQDIQFFNAKEVVNNFVGREGYLEEIYNFFKNGNNKLEVIGGLGGIGKTELVLKYIASHKEKEYNFRVRCIDAEDKASLDYSYREFAKDLSMNDEIADTSEISKVIKFVKSKLEKTVDKSLLIFDNVENKKLVDPYLPKTNGAKSHHIILTTRNTASYDNIQEETGRKVIKLDPFTEEEVVKYVQTYISDSNLDRNEVIKLGNLFDKIPLGLVHSMAFIKEKLLNEFGVDSIKEYMRQYEEVRQAQKLPESLHLALDLGEEFNTHAKNIYTTIELSLKSIDLPTALKMFYICSFLNAEKIPEDLFDYLFTQNGKSESLSVLKGYSLISERSGLAEEVATTKGKSSKAKLIYIHRIVQDVTKHLLETQGKAINSFVEAAKLVHSKMQNCYKGWDEQQILSKNRALEQHALELIKYYTKLSEEQKKEVPYLSIAELYGDLGNLYLTQKQYDIAKEKYKNALDLFNEVKKLEDNYDINFKISSAKGVLGYIDLALGAKAINKIKGLNNVDISPLLDIANKNFIAGWKEIKDAFVPIEEEYSEANDNQATPEVARGLYALGHLHYQIGSYSSSLTYLYPSLEIYLKHNNDKECIAEAGVVHYMIGHVYKDLKEHKKALYHYNKALEIEKKVYGNEEHPAILSTKQKISEVYYNTGEILLPLHNLYTLLAITRKIYNDEDHQKIRDLLKTIDSIEKGIPLETKFDEISRIISKIDTNTDDNIKKIKNFIDDTIVELIKNDKEFCYLLYSSIKDHPYLVDMQELSKSSNPLAKIIIENLSPIVKILLSYDEVLNNILDRGKELELEYKYNDQANKLNNELEEVIAKQEKEGVFLQTIILPEIPSTTELLEYNKVKELDNSNMPSLEAIGMIAFDVPRDGNCFFHAVEQQLKATNNNKLLFTHEELRKWSVIHIQNNKAKFESFMNDEDIDQYIDRISTNGQWADHPLVEALSTELHINIAIINVDHAMESPIVIGSNDNPNTIYIGHIPELHYIILRRLDSNHPSYLNFDSLQSAVQKKLLENSERDLAQENNDARTQTSHDPNDLAQTVDAIGNSFERLQVELVTSIKYTNSLLNNDRLIEVVSQFSADKKTNARIYNQLIDLSSDPEIREILIEEMKQNGEEVVVNTLFGSIKNTHNIKLPAIEYGNNKDKTNAFSAIENGPIISNSQFPEPERNQEKGFKLADIFYKAGMSFKVLDILADGAKVIYVPTLYNTRKVLVDYTHIYSMYHGVNTYSVLYNLCLSGRNIVDKVQQGEYSEALKESAVTTSYMFLPSMIGFINIPYFGSIYIATVTTQLAYSSFVKLHSFYQEYNTDEFNLKSSIAYKELYDSLLNSPISLIYDFSSKSNEYKIKINNINLEKDKTNLKQELEQKGEFGQKLYQFIFEPALKEKYDLLNKIIEGSITSEEAAKLESKHVQLTISNINYDECIERLSLKTEAIEHYYCYNENDQIIDHVVVGKDTMNIEVIERL